jgi:cytochrome b pre-mRNA-processing protein 3
MLDGRSMAGWRRKGMVLILARQGGTVARMSEPGQPRAGGVARRRVRAWRERLRSARQRRRARAAAAQRLYAALVEQARARRWFGALGVPDTPEGRFEMITLHVGLMLRRLRAEGPAGMALGQALFDLTFAELDSALRELGVGDLGVGRQVKRLAGQFYARLAGLDRALAQGGPEALAAALGPVWQGGPAPAPAQVAALAEALCALERHLGALPGSVLLQGDAGLPAPGR